MGPLGSSGGFFFFFFFSNLFVSGPRNHIPDTPFLSGGFLKPHSFLAVQLSTSHRKVAWIALCGWDHVFSITPA